jgi:hypothetical protein
MALVASRFLGRAKGGILTLMLEDFQQKLFRESRCARTEQDITRLSASAFDQFVTNNSAR